MKQCWPLIDYIQNGIEILEYFFMGPRTSNVYTGQVFRKFLMNTLLKSSIENSAG